MLIFLRFKRGIIYEKTLVCKKWKSSYIIFFARKSILYSKVFFDKIKIIIGFVAHFIGCAAGLKYYS